MVRPMSGRVDREVGKNWPFVYPLQRVARQDYSDLGQSHPEPPHQGSRYCGRVELDALAHLVDGSVHRIVLDGSALTDRAARELIAISDLLVEDRSVRVIVLESAGDAFCPGIGADLDPLSIDPAAALGRLRPPVIAVINGDCYSVGLELALACDIRLGGDSARFSLADLHDGRLPCWGGTQRLPRVIGAAASTELLLLGGILDAGDARRVGLTGAAGFEKVEDLVTALLGVGPLALELGKEAVHRGAELPLRDGLRLEGDLNHLLQATEDRAEGLAAFFDKRPPDFAGR